MDINCLQFKVSAQYLVKKLFIFKCQKLWAALNNFFVSEYVELGSYMYYIFGWKQCNH